MGEGFKNEDRMSSLKLTVQKVRGRKNMLTNVRSLIFSPSCVEALLSMTALALKSYYFVSFTRKESSRNLRLTPSLKAIASAFLCMNLVFSSCSFWSAI